ncbi:MAG: phosphoglycerate kinase [Spiroplasma phoeniceum]|uniref:phosphoglycerate kinase n=1 Tax=Spiroplasma phoeniceum TaxID=47835 RepID=UPI00328AEB7A
MTNKKELKDVQVKGKKVLVRVDFNVPMKDGQVTDDNRITAALPTIKYLLAQEAKVILFSHLGKVKTADDLEKRDMAPVAKVLEQKLGQPVKFINVFEGKQLEEAIDEMHNQDVILFQNTRFADIINSNGQISVDSDGKATAKRESKNDSALGKYWASLGDVFVNDAFGTAHRAHASNVGIAENIAESCLGFLVEKEVKMLSQGVDNPVKPFVAIIGGAKVSDKIGVIEHLLTKADKILIGGGMAYTFFAAQGHKIGNSLLEVDKVEIAKTFLAKAKGKIILPIDALEAPEFADVLAKVTTGLDIDDGYMGLDIGPKTIELFKKELADAKTVAWNGPMGVFEFKNYSIGTKAVCEAIAELKGAFTLIGGGDSAAAAIQLGYKDKFTHISTGGGASLEYMEGKPLPGIEAVQNK